jgi:hypothetical protein
MSQKFFDKAFLLLLEMLWSQLKLPNLRLILSFERLIICIGLSSNSACPPPSTVRRQMLWGNRQCCPPQPFVEGRKMQLDISTWNPSLNWLPDRPNWLRQKKVWQNRETEMLICEIVYVCVCLRERERERKSKCER